MKMTERWNYKKIGFHKYGHERTYAEPVAWLDEIGGVLEDWGCGTAYAKKYVKKSKYVGIEGSPNQWTGGAPVDLRQYTSQADCILLRDVIDHNDDWEQLLQNAVKSFQRRMVIVLFHYYGPKTTVLLRHKTDLHPDVPDIQFSREDIMKHVGPYVVKEYTVPHDRETPFNYVVIHLEKPPVESGQEPSHEGNPDLHHDEGPKILSPAGD